MDNPLTDTNQTYCVISGNVLQDLTIHKPDVALADMAAVISANQPDIVCLQEATVEPGGDARTGYLGQVATMHGMDTNFAYTNHLRRPRGSIHAGIATLVRPGLGARTTEITISQQRFATVARPIGRRALLITSFEDTERPLHIINAHLPIPTHMRWKQWKKLKETVEALDGDVVVTGDFNVRPDSLFIRWCNKHCAAVSDQTLPTWHSQRLFRGKPLPPRSRTLDYVFTNKDCKRKVTVEPLDRNGSDHIWHRIFIQNHSTEIDGRD